MELLVFARVTEGVESVANTALGDQLQSRTTEVVQDVKNLAIGAVPHLRQELVAKL